MEELCFNSRFRIPSRSPLLDMPYHPDDFGLHLKLLKMNPLPDGILLLEVGPCKSIIDVDHYRCVFVILRSYETAALESNSHGRLEPTFHQVKHRLRHF